MKKIVTFFIALLVIIPFGFGQMIEEETDSSIQRLAVFIGANNGGEERALLRYASTDARNMFTVMKDIGGIKEGNSILLVDPSVQSIDQILTLFKARISSLKDENKRVQFLLYYSGHSDETGLLIGETHFAYRELKQKLNDMDADITIAILDSCSSGAFTRLKGGSRQAPFLVDTSSDMKGHVYLTSSSEDEASQESDRIGASFFTYYLVAGLRGAADLTNDGKVTLSEAHSYAFSRTLERTEFTTAGPQHPSHAFNLTGSGELVITELTENTHSIVFDKEVQGSLLIRNTEGQFVAEIQKDTSSHRTIALPEGEYRITLNNDLGAQEATASLGASKKVTLTPFDFAYKVTENTRIRGDLDEKPEPVVYEVEPEYSVFGFSLIPGFPAVSSDKMVYGHSVNALIGHAYGINGSQTSMFLNFAETNVNGTQLSIIGNYAGGSISGYQGSAIYNVTKGNANGVQLAGIFNLALGNLGGLQLAPIFNFLGGSADGFQISGVFNLSEGNLKGLQLASIFNHLGGGFNGFQIAGVYNSASEESSGAQLSGIFNYTNKSVVGAQVAGVFNAADSSVFGFQGAAVVNFADTINGVQLSLLNIARNTNGGQIGLVNIGGELTGVQFGLVNITDTIKGGFPIGLINYSKDGLLHFNAWGDDLGYGWFGFQIGTDRIYTVLYSGLPYQADKIANNPVFVAGVGGGIHFDMFKTFFIESDITAKQVFYTADSDKGYVFPYPAARVNVGLKMGDRLRLYAGLTFDGEIEGITGKTIFHSGYKHTLTLNTTNVNLYQKFHVGIKF